MTLGNECVDVELNLEETSFSGNDLQDFLIALR